MRNWMMMALDAKLRAQANDEGADDGGFGDAFNEGIGEGGDGEGQPSSAGNEPPADDPEGGEAGGEGDAGAAGSGDGDGSDTGEGAGESTGESEGGEQGTGEGAGEGAGKGEGEGGQPTGQGTPQQTPAGGQQGQPAAVAGDNGVPPDQHAGQQQLDPATLEAIFKAMGNNQGQNRQDAQGQPHQHQGEQAAEPPKKEIPKDWTEYLTDEEKQTLGKYDADWSEVSQPERIRTQAMLRLQEDQILSRVEQALAPIAEHFQQSQVQSHFGRIREAHEDFDQLRESGSLNQWAQTLQNPMLRTQAQYVLQQGSTDEVIGLIDLYKQFTGQEQESNTGTPTGAALEVPASSQAPANGGQPKVTQQQGQTKPPKPAVDPKAAAATAAVKSGSRGADPRGGDKNDFMAGFEATASE